MLPCWPGNALGSSWKSWRKCPGRGKSGCPFSGSCPRDPAADKRTIMDGWMDGHLAYKETSPLTIEPLRGDLYLAPEVHVVVNIALPPPHSPHSR